MMLMSYSSSTKTALREFRVVPFQCLPVGRSAAKLLTCLLFVIATGGHLCAHTLANLGSVAPTPGTNDICQLSTQGNTAHPNKPDNINYYTDNDPPPVRRSLPEPTR